MMDDDELLCDEEAFDVVCSFPFWLARQSRESVSPQHFICALEHRQDTQESHPGTTQMMIEITMSLYSGS